MPNVASGSDHGIGPGFDQSDVTAGAAPPIHIQLLNDFRVAIAGRVIEARHWRLRRAAAIIKLLALTPTRRLSREQIIDQLWPNADELAGRNNLYQTLAVARRVLSGGAARHHSSFGILVGDPLRLSDGPVTVDVEAFESVARLAEATADPAPYHRAIALYAGDLLPDDLYDEWTVDRRVALRDSYLDLLLRVATLHEALGERDSARAMFHRLIAVDATQEEAHQGLMRLYCHANRPHLALRQFDRLVVALKRDVDTTPSLASLRLRADIFAKHHTLATLADLTRPPCLDVG